MFEYLISIVFCSQTLKTSICLFENEYSKIAKTILCSRLSVLLQNHYAAVIFVIKQKCNTAGCKEFQLQSCRSGVYRKGVQILDIFKKLRCSSLPPKARYMLHWNLKSPPQQNNFENFISILYRSWGLK